MKLSLSLLLLFTAYITRAQSLATDAFEQQLKQTPTGQLIDVRTPGEFGGGHLVGAKNLDYRNPAFAETLAQLDKAKPVFVYCLSGGRSGEAAKLMRAQGFANVYELEGGYLKWTTKLKAVEGVKADQSASSLTKEQLDKILTGNDLVLLDFYAPWCAPCVKMMPTIDALQQSYGSKLQVVKINADSNKDLLQAYQVDEIPTLLLMKKSQPKQRMIGLQTEAGLKEAIDGFLEK
ncbi:MAG: thioredoxin 1 [Cytophagales bacterium]|nr:MAG: thioredoxin 1 [Cytophagales bacterium]